jgi:sugar (pentulose or hexulose) kinase
MKANRIVVLDIGKTLAKLTLWSGAGELLDRRTRPNGRPTALAGYPTLDVSGIEDWMAGVLAEFARSHVIDAIVPVGHGAAAVVIEPGGGFIPPLDYEAVLPEDLAADYRAQRPAFAESGSPALPCGLNLGAQLHWLEAVLPERFRQGTIVTWAQFWAWRLCGVAACEVSSFGVHTDLWNPQTGAPSSLSVRRRWASRFAPVHEASSVLGTVTAYWRQRCGLDANCRVYCGLHDSNADLLALRFHPVIGAREHTVVSTGTWFIAMRSSPDKIALADLPEARDCLVNINPFGLPVPSARFMGGRETEILEAAPDGQLDPAAHESALIARAETLVRDGVFALPAFQEGVGPYPHHRGRWIGRPEDQLGRRAAAGLYLALMLNTSLGLIGAGERLVIQGRFLADPVFARALKSLRPADRVYLAPSGNSLCYGALSLIDPALVPDTPLTEAEPLPFDLVPYAAQWCDLLASEF